MNTPPTPQYMFEPVAALAMPDGTDLHSSVRTSLSTNTEPCGRSALAISTSRLEMKVVGGALQVRFTQDRIEKAGRLPNARARRTGARR